MAFCSAASSLSSTKGETALAAGFAVEGEAALADFAVLPEEIKQVLALAWNERLPT
jgi:hypothetical protein